MRTWAFSDLVTNHQTGKLRETVFWSNLGKAALLGAYIRYVDGTNYEAFTAVMSGILVVHELIKTKQNQDQQRLDKSNANPSA